MNNIVYEMLKKYETNTFEKKKNAVKEIIQEIVLCGLARANFFDKVVFYGGTALRIFYGLDRFSEDLDFSLMEKDPSFDLKEYLPLLEKEIMAFGLNMRVEIKEKSVDSNIKSAFLKGDTLEHMLYFYTNSNFSSEIKHGEIIKIKFEVDTNPPALAKFEHKFRIVPAPYEVNLYDIQSLFAGKIHAVLCRSWKNRIKGRDLYDYIFYIQRGASVNLPHLKERLIQSEVIKPTDDFTIEKLKEMLNEKFESINYEDAKKDVIEFVNDKKALDIWNKEFFKAITESLH